MSSTRERMENERERLHCLRDLLQSPGWAVLQEYLKGQIYASRNIFMQHQVTSLDKAFESAALQARAAMWQVMRALPDTLIEDAELVLTDLRAQLEEEEEHDRNERTGGESNSRSAP